MANAASIMGSKLLGKSLSAGTVLTVGMDAWIGSSTYKASQEEGNSQLTSLAKAGGEIFINHTLGMGAYIGMQAVTGLPKMGIKAYEGLSKMSRGMSDQGKNNPFSGANFMDSQQSYTMRQAGMQMAKSSKYNQQQAMLGNEAQYMHL